MLILMLIFLSFWGRSCVPLGGHVRSCWRLFRPKLVSEPTSNRLIFDKIIFHETLRFPTVFGKKKLRPRWGQERPKIAPRAVQDRLGSAFCHLDYSLRCLIVLGWAVQDGLGIVLVRSFFRLAIRDHFFGPLLGHLGRSWARFWALRVAFWNPAALYAHQLVNASTLQPVARQHFVTRAGGLRAERLNPPPGPQGEGETTCWIVPV